MTTIKVIFFPFFFMMFTVFCYYVLNPYPSEFSIVSASVSSFTITDSKLSANFDLTLSALNPNKYRGVHYDNVAATLDYGPDTIALAVLPAFHLRGWNSTTVAAMAKEVREYYTSIETIKGIITDLDIHKAVVFDVNVYARGSFESPMEVEKFLKVKCKDVTFRFNNNSDAASMVGPPVTCQVVEWD